MAKTECTAKTFFLARHSAAVGFVIVTCEVEHAVQNQNFQLLRGRVLVEARVAAGDLGRDHDLARELCGTGLRPVHPG